MEFSNFCRLVLPEEILETIATIAIALDPSSDKGPNFAAVCKACRAVTNKAIRKIFFKIPTLHEDNADAFKTYFAKYLNKLTPLESLTFRLDNHHQKTPGILTRLVEILSEKLSDRTKFVDLTFDLLENSNDIEVKNEIIEDLTQALIHVGKFQYLENLTINLEIDKTNVQPVLKLLMAFSQFVKAKSLNLNLKIKSMTLEGVRMLEIALKNLTNLKNLTEIQESLRKEVMLQLAEALQPLPNLTTLPLPLNLN